MPRDRGTGGSRRHRRDCCAKTTRKSALRCRGEPHLLATTCPGAATISPGRGGCTESQSPEGREHRSSPRPHEDAALQTVIRVESASRPRSRGNTPESWLPVPESAKKRPARAGIHRLRRCGVWSEQAGPRNRGDERGIGQREVRHLFLKPRQAPAATPRN